MKKALFTTMIAMAVSAFLLMAQDPAKFNGTWKGDGGQVRKLTFKDGIVLQSGQERNDMNHQPERTAA